MPDEPDYKVYRSRPKLFKGREDRVAEGLQELRDEAPHVPRQPGAKPEYTTHRRRRLPRPRMPKIGSITGRRVLKWVLAAIGGWILLSVLLFLISAQINSKGVSNAAESALSGGSFPLVEPTTILVLGSDARVPGLAEPGAEIGGPSRSDSIMLLRTGGGKSAKLSIPRDLVVDIPGHGPDKINAAFAIGGPSLTITTIEQFLDIDINHVVLVDFGNFPEFIDSLGGINIETNCVVSNINGGKANGGTTLKLKAGDHHLDGADALTLARTRKNECHPEETDLDRAQRQQDVLSAIKSRIVSPSTFLRLPWVAWQAPKAVQSDMRGFSLMQVAGALSIGGNPKPQVLGGLDTAGGVSVSDEEKAAAVKKFLDG
jgi:LCP family protein required for cell wall assembly